MKKYITNRFGRKLPLVNLKLPVYSCAECPKVKTARHPGAGYAIDYFCTAIEPEKKVMNYIEWDSERTPVPDWCPLRPRRKKRAKKKTESKQASPRSRKKQKTRLAEESSAQQSLPGILESE